MVLCLGFLSFYYLHSALERDKNNLIIWSGIFAGLAAFTHLNGVIYSVAGFGVLLIKKEYRKVLFFSIFAGLFTLLYFFDIHSVSDLNALIYQLETDPNVVDKAPFYVGLLNEQIRLFHSPNEISFSFLFLFALILNFKYLKQNYSVILLYLVILFVSLGVLSHGKTPKYGLNYAPYMAIITIIGFRNLINSKLWVKLSGCILIATFIIIHCFENYTMISRRIDISEHSEKLASLIPEQNVKISAPATLVFNQINKLTIRAEIAWSHHYYVFHPDEKRSIENYFQFAKEHNDKYILFDKSTNNNKILLGIFDLQLSKDDVFNGYRVISRSDSYILFGIENEMDLALQNY
jgi:hypothetical protein